MIPFTPFFEFARTGVLKPWLTEFQSAIEKRYLQKQFGDENRWQASLERLPAAKPSIIDLQDPAVTVGAAADLTAQQQTELHDALQSLSPWRKGPFQVFSTLIDSEWRSNMKWQRVQSALGSLHGLSVLDVGCGNGYYAWRARGDGAAWVLGVDPSVKFLYQFQALARYLPEEKVFMLPLRGEDLPRDMGIFDLVLSMGVLYHRRSPFAHLEELKGCLKPKGRLVLETLVVPGDEQSVLVPADRYAQMRNVWFLPSVAALSRWLERVGLVKVRCVDISHTTGDEQRQTEWMTFHSLDQFLMPGNPALTIEGYPAPMRALMVAERA